MFGSLEEALDRVVADGPAGLPAADAVCALDRQRNRMDYAMARQAAAFDRDKCWAVDGAQNAAAWLAAKLRMARQDAYRFLRAGRRLRHMPLVADAFSEGDISLSHVEAIGRLRRPATLDAFERDEAFLVEQAKTLTYAQFQRVIAAWDDAADPDRGEDDAKKLHDDRALHLSQSYQGAWFLDGNLDPVGGLTVADELRRLERRLFNKDWNEARQHLGRKPLPDELARTPAQRRADALVEMAIRSRAMPKGARKPEPLFSVIVGLEGLHRLAELHNRTLVHPASLTRWLSNAWIERVVFDSPSRAIDIGRRRRLFSAAQRRLIQVRDRECTHPCCDRPATECETDHITPYSQGGETTCDSGRMHCDFHNQLRNHQPDPPPPDEDHPGPAP
jgi:hypothetical protein